MVYNPYFLFSQLFSHSKSYPIEDWEYHPKLLFESENTILKIPSAITPQISNIKSGARQLSQETLTKELDCVNQILKGSLDFKGIELHLKACEMISKADNKIMSTKDVCTFIIHFFKCKFLFHFVLNFRQIIYRKL